MSLDPQSGITTQHTYLPSPLPSSPSFHLHLTRLKDTLMIWVGAGEPSDPTMPGVEANVGPSEKRLAGDWAVAMPARGNIPVTGTPVFSSGASDLALPLAQRLGGSESLSSCSPAGSSVTRRLYAARRFPPNQIHLSLSFPTTLTSPSGPSLDPFASRVLLLLEKKLGLWLETLLEKERKDAL
ncbi:MAG: hypothetical protein TREMPRED_000548 [Tremellales sp. Tagirdzhanova-0007]|nr:MAG: hypothetical protein TREMPRED_000548 [Tremellales sp. Tagirdzhanova-0007]